MKACYNDDLNMQLNIALVCLNLNKIIKNIIDNTHAEQVDYSIAVQTTLALNRISH